MVKEIPSFQGLFNFYREECLTFDDVTPDEYDYNPINYPTNPRLNEANLELGYLADREQQARSDGQYLERFLETDFANGLVENLKSPHLCRVYDNGKLKYLITDERFFQYDSNGNESNQGLHPGIYTCLERVLKEDGNIVNGSIGIKSLTIKFGIE